MKLEFVTQIFENVSNITFHQTPSSESRVVPRGQTDGHDKANSRFSQLRENRKTDEKKNFHTLNTLAGIMRQQMIRAPEQAHARLF